MNVMDKKKLKVEIYKAHKEALELMNDIFDKVLIYVESKTLEPDKPKVSSKYKMDLLDAINVAGRDTLFSINDNFNSVIVALEKEVDAIVQEQASIPEPPVSLIADNESTEGELTKEQLENFFEEVIKIWYG